MYKKLSSDASALNSRATVNNTSGDKLSMVALGLQIFIISSIEPKANTILVISALKAFRGILTLLTTAINGVIRDPPSFFVIRVFLKVSTVFLQVFV